MSYVCAKCGNRASFIESSETYEIVDGDGEKVEDIRSNSELQCCNCGYFGAVYWEKDDDCCDDDRDEDDEDDEDEDD